MFGPDCRSKAIVQAVNAAAHSWGIEALWLLFGFYSLACKVSGGYFLVQDLRLVVQDVGFGCMV